MREIIEKIRQAGVVGAGGAGFPTHLKLSARVEHLIINASECEPLLAVDRLLVEHYADRLVSTARLLASRLGAKHVLFAVKKKYTHALSLLQDLSRNDAGTSLALLDDVYPAGDEQVIVYDVLRRVIPEGGIPLHVGAVVLNVETLLNIANALEGHPVTHTYCTIAGSVAQPLTLRLPVGVSVREAIALVPDPVHGAGEFSETTHAVLEGGPMMGRLIENWSEPVAKTTKGLIILPRDHYLAVRYINVPREVGKNIVSICCSCLQCTEVCPRFLLGHTIEPQKLMVAAASGLDRTDRIFHMAHYCCECGICELWACFMFLSPRHLIAHMRRDLARRGIRRTPFKDTFAPHPAREFRKVHAGRLKSRLQITALDRPARFRENGDLDAREVLIPLKQYSGKPATPIVKKGDKVRAGTPVAIPPVGAKRKSRTLGKGALGAIAHSSIDGRVTEISEQFVRIQKT